MKIDISTLSANLIAPMIGETRIVLSFGDAHITEWPVPEADLHRVGAGDTYSTASEDEIREYVEEFVARKLETLFQNGA